MYMFMILILSIVCGEYSVAQTTVQESLCTGDVHVNTQMDRIVALLESLNQRVHGLEDSQARLEENQARLEVNQARLEENQERFEQNQASPFINLARGRPASQSSTYNWIGTLCTADLAVDGKSGREFHDVYCRHCAHTNGEGNAWWAVDLGRQYHVNRVEIAGRSDDETASMWFRDVYIGATDASPFARKPNVNNFSRCTFIPDPLAMGETRSFGCDDGAVSGRYVIILKTFNSQLSLCEVKVFGYK